MKVLVTGGTGFVGREVVGRLVGAGHEVRVLTRGRQGSSRSSDLLPGSVLRPETLAPACSGCDAVVHLVGIISEVGDQTFERVHVDGTRNLLRAAAAAGAGTFVHMSALGARPGAASRYHQTKWAAEELVRASGLRWTVFRPSIIHGPGDAFVNLFARLSRWSPVLPVIGSGRGLLQPIAVADVARCFAGALTLPAAAGRTYELVGRDRLSFREVLEAIGEVTGRRRPGLSIPTAIARVQAAAMECVWPRLLRRAPPLNRDQILMLAEDNVGDPGPMMRDFGIDPEPFREAIRRFL